jgi:hypothetical protein
LHVSTWGLIVLSALCLMNFAALSYNQIAYYLPMASSQVALHVTAARYSDELNAIMSEMNAKPSDLEKY